MEEKLAILKMVEDGKITVEEAAKLLEALEHKEEALVPEVWEDDSSNNRTKAKWLKVRVTDETGKVKVKVNMPMALVSVGLKIGAACDKNAAEYLRGIDVDEIVKLVKEGAEGKIVDVESENGEKVEVTVE